MNSQTYHIRSFVRREGHASEKRKETFEKLWPVFGIESGPDRGLLDLDQLFARQAPCFLEIGFGTGTTLIETASRHPQNNYLGIEVYRTGIASLLNKIHALGLSNIRIFDNDAVDVLCKQIGDQSLDGVCLFFPDPWQKRRHNKRRIVQTAFIQLIVQKLKPGALFHAATDWEDYAQHMMTVLSANTALINRAGKQNYSPKPECRPITKFEQRGHKLGHGIWDLLFQRTNPARCIE